VLSLPPPQLCWQCEAATTPLPQAQLTKAWSPRLEYEARNQKKEAKELAFLEAMRQQEVQTIGEND
jgi:hypothetical protein